MGSNVISTTATILSGATAFATAVDTRLVDTLSIAAPSSLPETVKVISPDGSTIQSPPGTDVVIAAGKTIVFTDWPYNSIQLASGTTAADRVFTIYGMRRQSGT